MAGTRRRAKRFALYWCTTADGDEDWFVVAHSPREAKRFHEDAEGYERGDADAERVALLPPELHTDGGWKDAANGGVQRSAGWPSDQVLVLSLTLFHRLRPTLRRDRSGVISQSA